jgi:hypothetical protein
MTPTRGRNTETLLALAGPGLVLAIGGLLLLARGGLGPAAAPQVADPERSTVGRPISLADPRLASLRGEGAPSPTEIEQWRGDRRERRRHREEWLESLHWAPPGTDWKAIEAENRRALALERYARIEGGERTGLWDELGSVNLAGRTHAAVPSSDGVHLYVGSNLGGVWRGTLDGQDWQPLSDGLGLGSFRLAVAPAAGAEPEVVLTQAGATLHASDDGGLTWFVPAGLPDNIYESIRVLHDPGHPRTIYFLSRSGAWIGGEFVYGFQLSRSLDGGHTFQIRCSRPGTPRCDLWIDRVSGGPLYLMQGNTLLRSNDGGATFQTVGTAPPASVADVVLAASEAGGPTFYAALKEGSDWKLYRSEGGASWVFRRVISDFWETMVASTLNRDLLFVAGVECWRSTNGGVSFAKVNNWWDYYGDPQRRLHADLPGMDVHRFGSQERIYFNTDGGTYVSTDGGATVQNLSLWGLAISQYYGTLTSSTDPYLIAAGSQDQGYQQSTPGGRAAYLPFEQLISGDYGHLTSTTRAHDWLYSVYPGFVLLQVNEAAPQELIQLDFPAGSAHAWMPPILADPRDPDVFYLCADHLWKYERTGGYTYAMTELPQDFAANSAYVSALAISPADYDYWYAVTNTGLLWYSHDAGVTWTQSASYGPHAHYFYGTALVASPGNREVAYVGGSGYAGHPVWKTTDGGVTWTGTGQGLPSTLVLGLALGGPSGEDLFAACEAGPYAFQSASGEWASAMGTEAPLTTYWCVEWVPEIGVARFGTYGRGIWDYAPPAPGSLSQASPAIGLRLEVSPVPARRALTLRFEMPRAGHARLELFDVSGRCVARIAEGVRERGAHQVDFDLTGAHLAPGTYLARLACGAHAVVRKVPVVE